MALSVLSLWSKPFGSSEAFIAYRTMKSHHEIATTVERILQSDTLVVQSEQEAFIANIAFKTGTVSFSDALIGARLL